MYKKHEKMLLLGNSTILRSILNSSEDVVMHHYESLMNLMYDQPVNDYEAAVVGYDDSDEASVEAARYLDCYFDKMPIFIVSDHAELENISSGTEKVAELTQVTDGNAALNHILGSAPVGSHLSIARPI